MLKLIMVNSSLGCFRLCWTELVSQPLATAVKGIIGCCGCTDPGGAMEVSEAIQASNDSLAALLLVFGVHTGVSFEWFGSVGDVTTDGFRGRVLYLLSDSSDTQQYEMREETVTMVRKYDNLKDREDTEIQ